MTDTNDNQKVELPDQIQINLDIMHECIDTWIPLESEGYKLYLNEQVSEHKPSNEYVLVKYTHTDSSIVDMGHVTIKPEKLTHRDINNQIENQNLTKLTENQWNVVNEAYHKLSKTIFDNQIFEGVPQLYQKFVYHNVNDLQKLMERNIDKIYDSMEKAQEYEDNDKKDWYDQYLEYNKLGNDQYQNIGTIIQNTVEWNNSDIVPYAQSCQFAAKLEFDTYENWKVRALEHYHNGVLYNKPELAKVKAMLEEGMKQCDIVDKLDKSPSTVSRQAKAVQGWEQRAEWTVNQN